MISLLESSTANSSWIDLECDEQLLPGPWYPVPFEGNVHAHSGLVGVDREPARRGEVTPSPHPCSSGRVSVELDYGHCPWAAEDLESYLFPQLDSCLQLQVPVPLDEDPPMSSVDCGNTNAEKWDGPDRTVSAEARAEKPEFWIMFPELNLDDVLLGRSPRYYSQPGNQRFLNVLKPKYQPLYEAARKIDKRGIAQQMVNEVHDVGGRFMRYDEATEVWLEVPNEVAREKASQALREHLSKEERKAKRLRYPKSRK